MGRRDLTILALAGILLLPSCGDDEASLGSGAADGKPRSTAGSDGAGPESPALPTLAAARGPFFDWLPRDTCLALRVPHLNRLGDALAQTTLAQALGELDPENRWRGLIAAQVSALGSELLAGLDPGSLLAGLEGDLVFALVAVHPEVFFEGDDVLPVTGVVYAELAEDSSSVVRWVETCMQQAGGSPDFEGLADGSVRGQLDTGACHFEVVVREGVLALGFAPPGSPEGGLDRWMALAPEDSLRSSSLLRSLPDESLAGEVLCAEAFLNLTPAWRMVLAMAPPEVQQALRSTKMTSLHGFSMIASLDGPLVHERVRMHSPGGQDALSRLLGAADLDPEYVRWIPADVDQGMLLAFEPAKALDSLLGMMPGDARTGFEDMLHEAGNAIGIDLRRELLEKLGPRTAIAARGMPGSSDFQMSMAVECRGEEDLGHWLDRLLGASGLIRSRRLHATGKHEFFSVALPPMPGVSAISESLEPCYAFIDGVLLIGANPESMRRALTAAEAQGKLAPRELRECLDNQAAGLWSVTYTDLGTQLAGSLEQWEPMLTSGQAQLPFVFPDEERWGAFCARLGSSVSSFRRDEMGAVFDSRSTIGTATAAMVVGGMAVVASVALPNLVAARSEARESEITGTLLEIAAAQRQIKDLAVIDTDGDGEGEYAYFAELAGAVAVRGRANALASPLLDADFGAITSGCLRRHGFLFRMDLPDGEGAPISETSTGGSPRNVDPDGAEAGWVVYAWPEGANAPTSRAYVIDETGLVFYSENTGAEQGYRGVERVPAGDASYLKAGNNRVRGRSVRRGQDKSLWLEMETGARGR